MLLQDLKYALRMLARRPVFTGVATLTLALGIGANAAMFSVVHAVLIAPLPYAAPDRLVHISGLDRDSGEAGNLSAADFLDFARESRTIARMGAHGWIGPATVGVDGLEAERTGRVLVTEGFFPALGVQPVLGRLFRPEEDRPGPGDDVAIVAHGYWQRRLGGDPSAVGRVIHVNSRPVEVIGVLPASYRHVEERTDRTADLFMLQRYDPTAAPRGSRNIRAVGRLADGVTIDEARAELDAMAARFEAAFPESNTGQGAHVAPLHEHVVGDSRPALVLLLGAVGLVLLVACANLANLLLAAGAGRAREVAVRAALGAARGRLVRQMITEALVIGGAGAVAGLLLARAATSALGSLASSGVPRAGDIAVDGTVVAFALALGLATSVVFGLAPAWSLSGRDVHAPLRAGGRQAGDPARQQTRRLLIAAEVALSVMLLVGATLLLQSLWRLEAVDPGFRQGDAVAMDVALPLARYPEGTQMPFYERLEARIRDLPGVLDAGAVNILPLTANYDSRGIQIDDAPLPAGQNPSVQARSVTPGYFGAMGIPLLRGRLFDARDTMARALVVVISESMAERYWPGQDPLGRRLTFNSGIEGDDVRPVGGAGSREIVGVVGDVRHLALTEEAPIPMFYTPHTQQPSYHAMTLVVRTPLDAAALTPAVRTLLSEADRDVPLANPRALAQVVAGTIAAPRLRAVLLSSFAALALVLAAIGVYGVVAHLVGQRTREIGVRLALGASPASIVRLLVSDGLRPVAVGLCAGIAGALAMSRVLQAMLFDVAPTDPAAYVTAAGALALTALVAALVPARRALRVAPVTALGAD